MLIGLSPNQTDVIDEYNDNQSIDYHFAFGLPLLNGDEICSDPSVVDRATTDHSSPRIGPQELLKNAKSRFRSYAELHTKLMAYWSSGRHPEITPATYFVEWANSKHIDIDWLPVAEEMSLIPASIQAQRKGAASDRDKNSDKPLKTIERNTLLTIIAALCDNSNIKYEDRGAAIRIMEVMDGFGAHIDDGTIRNVLKQIPEALSTRLK